MTGGRFRVNPVNSSDDAAIALAATWLSQVDYKAQYDGYLLIPTPESQYGQPALELFYYFTPSAAANAAVTSVAVVPEATTVIAGTLLILPLGASAVPLKTLVERWRFGPEWFQCDDNVHGENVPNQKSAHGTPVTGAAAVSWR